MVVFKCSVCHNWSSFTLHCEREVQSERISEMTHVLIPTTFQKCGHLGIFRWDRKSFIGLCKLQGITPNIKEWK